MEYNQFFGDLVKSFDNGQLLIDKAIDIIFKYNGSIEINQPCKDLFTTERQLQRVFKKYIGVPPKIYARIIRFNYLFQLMKNPKPLLTQMAFDAGYYDQSHLVRNFKNFTGEEPSGYFFDEKNLANFFLKKTDE